MATQTGCLGFFTQQYEEVLKTWPEEITKGFDPEGVIWAYDALRLYDEGLPGLAVGTGRYGSVSQERFTSLYDQLA